MNIERDRTNQLLQSRQLPEELSRSFKDAKISFSEQMEFRDRLFATVPTPEEVEEVVRAKNPWAVLGRLEEDAGSEEREKRRAAMLKSLGSSVSRADAQREKESASPKKEPRSSGKPVGEEGLSLEEIVSRFEQLDRAEVTELVNRFNRVYRLDQPGADYEQALDGVKLKMYQAAQIVLGRNPE